jgi:signal peptidase II
MSSSAANVSSPGTKNKYFYIAIALVMLASDQLTKYWVALTRRDSDDLEVIPGLLNISYTENQGIAFGMLNRGDFKWLLVAISVAAIIVVAYYMMHASPSNRLLLWSLALLAAGITGNLIDRIRLGRVIDFIQVYIVVQGARHEWPVFNVADTAITIGASLMAIELLVSPSPAKEREESSKSEAIEDPPHSQSEAVPPLGTDGRGLE